ncbi:Eukaryotic translation initiation factor 3 subunit B [Fukomys damarensis]|uniref:Eukaryotic translation initiation factor 3 subunit B n=1 Tax=Fukomys damarensis TaxID=885580 RepID=A0A091EE86_FUKDA|nr:Eukaryotic translation initiation factor 3 subunit B [Fukomys damarensis]
MQSLQSTAGSSATVQPLEEWSGGILRCKLSRGRRQPLARLEAPIGFYPGASSTRAEPPGEQPPPHSTSRGRLAEPCFSNQADFVDGVPAELLGDALTDQPQETEGIDSGITKHKCLVLCYSSSWQSGRVQSVLGVSVAK